MKRAQLHAPPPGQATDPAVQSLLDALGTALARTDPRPWQLAVEQQRLAGRSRLLVVRGTAGSDTAHWVVKQPNTRWTQDDVGSPLSAEHEFRALERLHAHFSATPSHFDVPAPVALLPEAQAFAMEYVVGRNLKELLTYRSALQPSRLLQGFDEAARFLRELHAIEELPSVVLDLEEEAQGVLAVAADKLHPLGLELPGKVRAGLESVGAQKVEARQVWLHGDFGPANVLQTQDGSLVGIDASLDTIGQPEDDLVRFVALVSGIIRLAPEVALPPYAVVRRELEARLLRSYYGTDTWPALFELRYLHQLVRRWCRLRELAEQHERSRLVRPKLAVITRQVQLLMVDSERRLQGTLAGTD